MKACCKTELPLSLNILLRNILQLGMIYVLNGGRQGEKEV